MAEHANWFHLIVPHREAPRALVLPEEEGWALPRYRGPQPVLWADVGHVNAAAGRLLGLEGATLYCLAVSPAPDCPRTDFAYVLDPLDHDWQPPAGARWVMADDLQHLRLAHPEQKAFLSAWFVRQVDAAAGSRRPPWYEPGWFAEAALWFRGCLDAAEGACVLAVEQVRSCGRSAVLRARTSAGTAYLKAVPPMFAHELPLTAELAQQYPGCLPRVIATDATRRWLVMSDAGDQDLGAVWDTALPRECLRSYARIQIEQSASVSHWLAHGCPDHRLERLGERMDELLSDTAAMQPDASPVSLAAEEIARLRSLGPTLQRLCGELAASHVPYSLEHGDLWTQQILTREGRFALIDWSDTTVSHPFFSLCYFFGDREALAAELSRSGQRSADAARLCRELTEAYLEPWTAFERRDRLQSLLDLAHRLVGLHLALLYRERIVPGLEQPWEMQRMIPHFLRRVLRSVDGTCDPRRA